MQPTREPVFTTSSPRQDGMPHIIRMEPSPCKSSMYLTVREGNACAADLHAGVADAAGMREWKDAFKAFEERA